MAPLSRGEEMPRRCSAVTGKEVRVSQTRIQVEPRVMLLTRPEPKRLGAFFLYSAEPLRAVRMDRSEGERRGENAPETSPSRREAARREQARREYIAEPNNHFF